MKTFKKILTLAAFAVSIELTATAQELTPGTTVSDTNAVREFSQGRGLRFETDGMSLSTLLDYMSEAAGYVIQLKPGVEVTGKVNIRSAQPLDKDEALAVLKQVLSDYGYAAIANGRLLTIIRSSDAPRGYAPVRLGNKPEDVPRTAEIVTQIIPIRHLNPVELVKVLRPLLPENIVPTVDESANAIIITDTQSNIRRALEVIAALDSVSASANTLRVFPLHYADAKSLAALVKELFTASDAPATGGRVGRGNTIAPIRFTGRGGPGGTADGGDSGQTPITRVAAVADEHGNSLIVSAPDSVMPAIEQLVDSVDMPVDELVEFRAFTLRNSDCDEMADALSKLFPDENNSADASRASVLNPGQGGRGATQVGARQGTAGEVTGASSRTRKLGRVLAVPDRRTGTLLVTAAKSLMPQIDEIIHHLDSIEAGRVTAHVFNIQFADGYEIQQKLAEAFPSATISVNSQSDPMEIRRAAMFNTFFTTGSASGRSSSTSTTIGRGSN